MRKDPKPWIFRAAAIRLEEGTNMYPSAALNACGGWFNPEWPMLKEWFMPEDTDKEDMMSGLWVGIRFDDKNIEANIIMLYLCAEILENP